MNRIAGRSSRSWVRLTPERAARMLSLFAARQMLGLPKRPVLWRALYGLAAQKRRRPNTIASRWV